MSLVGHKKSSPNEPLTLADLLRDRWPFLGIAAIIRPQGLRRVLVRPHVRCRRSLAVSHQPEDAIVILSPRAQEKFSAIAEPGRRAFVGHLALCRTALVVLAQTTTCPASLKSKLQRWRIPAAVSSLPESLLESRFQAILEEQIKKRTTVHGIAMEAEGRGLLVRGPSGIGKTTTLLQAIGEGYVWIADDRVVVRKNRRGKLVVSGHKKIRDYFHTNEDGVMAVNRLVPAEQIKKETELAFIIDVDRTDGGCGACRLEETEIMKTRLPLIRMDIPRTGYFNKNLLSKAIQKISEVD
ncbi:MAG: hypothetical protein EG826_00550 [Deltaproteobacteria bacterium]|nr:hypothetical protein [Deltaproteobacteria bacterium]